MSLIRNELGQVMTRKTNSMDNATRIIEVCNDKIIYTLKLDGVKDYLTYNETLLTILKMDKLKPFRDKGRLRFKVRENGADFNMYLYDLAFACYSGQVRSKSFISDMQKYYEQKAFNNLSIDHADNNVRNNTKYNLSLMDKTLNSTKGTIIARVKMPAYLNVSFCNDKYRVQLLWTVSADDINNSIGKLFNDSITDTAGLCAMHFICESAESFVDCLQYIISLKYEWALPLKDGGNWVKNNNPCWCENINHSMHAQEILSKMNEADFQVFNRLS